MKPIHGIKNNLIFPNERTNFKLLVEKNYELNSPLCDSGTDAEVERVEVKLRNGNDINLNLKPPASSASHSPLPPWTTTIQSQIYEQTDVETMDNFISIFNI